MNKKLQILKEIATRLNKEKITWAVGASLLLYLKGLVPCFHDIDIMVLEEDEDKATLVLQKMGKLQPKNPNINYHTKTFLEFVIEEVDVDVMIGFAIAVADGIKDCALKPEQILEYYDLEGEKIPLHSLKLWEQYYKCMGRDEKAELIRNWIKNEIIEKAIEYVKTLFSHEFSGHDYHHTMRVVKMAERLAGEEGADIFVVALAALLHDVDDIKLSPHTHEKKENAIRFMQQVNLEMERIKQVCTIIEEISYGGKSLVPSTIEGKCVQDADRLDALGAIGIARAFAFGGNHQRVMHDPEILPNLNMSKEEYRKSNSTTINHFYEKLFRLKELMNTESAKKIAREREHFMKAFLEEFNLEWQGEQ